MQGKVSSAQFYHCLSIHQDASLAAGPCFGYIQDLGWLGHTEKNPIENDLVKKFLTFLIREREVDGSEKQHKRWDGREGGYSYQVDILEFPIFYS